MSCLPRGLKEEKKKEKAKLHRTKQEENSLNRGLGGCLTDGENLIEFNQIDHFHG